MENEQDLISMVALELILSRVPLKSRTRFKCVSKDWNSLISNLRYNSPPTTTSGLVFASLKPFRDGALHHVTLLDVKDQCQSCSISTSITHNLPWLIDSCNGLLLFGAKDGTSLTYHVFSPLTKQWLQLPCAHDFLRPASASLAFDGMQPHFKVLCQFWEEADIKKGTIKYQIFPSKTWEWRECSARIPNSALLLSKNFNSNEWSCPSLYRKGHIYWIWSLLLLIFYEEKESFELMELPKIKNMTEMSIHCAKRLWESEERLHYCDSTYVGFFIWDYADVRDNNSKDNTRMWRLKHCIRLEELVTRSNYEEFQIPKDMMFSISPFTVKPCAYNEDLEILYFQLPGCIAAYSFEMRKLVKVQSDSAIGRSIHDNVYPFTFKAVDLKK
ncbi:hypothetical protein DITRI_Ditri03aG0206600 [Diplodiscus trichospermus]